MVKSLPTMQKRVGNLSLGQEDSLEKRMDPLQYSCIENSMDRGAWRATVHGLTESDTIEQLMLSHTQSAVKNPLTVSFYIYISKHKFILKFKNIKFLQHTQDHYEF